MKGDGTGPESEDLTDVGPIFAAALGAASPHRPPPDLGRRVLDKAIRGKRGWFWRYVAVAAALVIASSAITWQIASNQGRAAAGTNNPDVSQLEATNEMVFDIITCKGGAVLLLRGTQPGSVSYGKLYMCPNSNECVFMSGKLVPPPTGKEYELWLTANGDTNLQDRLNVWRSLADSRYYFGSVMFKAGSPGEPSYEFAQLTLQAPKSQAPENPVIMWSGA